MKLKGIFVSLIGVFAIVCASPAFASSHGAAPQHGFVARAKFEAEHFAIHMGKTADSIGWFLAGNVSVASAEMATQIQCAGATPVASVLFTTPLRAVSTFLAVLLLPLAALYALRRKIFVMMLLLATALSRARSGIVPAPSYDTSTPAGALFGARLRLAA